MLRWPEVEPVLQTVYRLLDESPHGEIAGMAVADALGRDVDARFTSLFRRLEEQDWVSVGYWAHDGPLLIRPTPKGSKDP